jgi:predicted nucleotidyltransferase
MKVSDAVKKRLEELVAALATAHGEALVSVLAHGSAVRGGWRDGSDVDVVVVLREASREALERSANALQGARWSARIEAMILLEREIARAADVFPVFYDEIKQHHEVLHGSDPFAALAIERGHLRLRVEQELREAQIRMRRALVDAQGNRDHLRGLVERKVRQVRSPLRALLDLRGRGGEHELGAVLRATGQLLSADVSALGKVDEDPAAAHDALVSLLDRAIAEVDAMEGAS